jgi:hypothetical protein
MCSLPRSRGPRLSQRQLRALIEHWHACLEITQLVRAERISRFQVTDEHGRPGAGLIGVVFDAHQAIIYHTRTLTPEDVLHELLHVAHPTWSEATVVRATTRGWRRRPSTRLHRQHTTRTVGVLALPEVA